MPPPPFKPSPRSPPSFRPKGKIIPHDLTLEWGCDPFDPRFVENAAGMPLTPLGVAVNVLWWWMKHGAEITPHAVPIINQLRLLLERHCPDQLAELDYYLETL